MKGIFDKDIGRDAIEMRGVSGAKVEKNEKGQPKAWQLFPFGKFSLSSDTLALSVNFRPEDADTIMTNYAKKAEKLPIDCNHLTQIFAAKHGVTENDVIAMTGEKHLAAGFFALEKRDDGLWCKDVDWLAMGEKLLEEKVFRYFSPVLRGCSDGNLRITSQALVNNPAIDQQDALVASAISKQADGAFAVEAKKLLDLPGAQDSVALAAFNGLLEKVKGYDAMKKQVDELVLSAKTKEREAVVAQGVKEGKLTNAMLEWANGQDAVSLSAFLKFAPVVVPVDGLPPSAPAGDSIAMSAEAMKIYKNLGLSAEQIENIKKGK